MIPWRRMILVSAVCLITGLFSNIWLPRGIPPNVLFRSAGKSASVVTFLSAESAYVLYQNRSSQFIDVRPAEEFSIDHIPHAVSWPVSDILNRPEQMKSLDEKSRIVIYDFSAESPNSHVVARLARDFGIENVYVLFGGFSEWLQYGFPTEGNSGLS